MPTSQPASQKGETGIRISVGATCSLALLCGKGEKFRGKSLGKIMNFNLHESSLHLDPNQVSSQAQIKRSFMRNRVDLHRAIIEN